MNGFTMARAKRDFSRGLFVGAEIRWMGLGVGYGLWLNSILGAVESGFLVDAKRREPRRFRTADACIKAFREIGFDLRALKVEGD